MQLSPVPHWALVEHGLHEVEQTRSGRLHTSVPSQTKTVWKIGTQEKPPQSASLVHSAQLVQVLRNCGSAVADADGAG